MLKGEHSAHLQLFGRGQRVFLKDSALSIFPSALPSALGPTAEKHLRHRVLPPPCFTVWYVVDGELHWTSGVPFGIDDKLT